MPASFLYKCSSFFPSSLLSLRPPLQPGNSWHWGLQCPLSLSCLPAWGSPAPVVPSEGCAAFPASFWLHSRVGHAHLAPADVRPAFPRGTTMRAALRASCCVPLLPFSCRKCCNSLLGILVPASFLLPYYVVLCQRDGRNNARFEWLLILTL